MLLELQITEKCLPPIFQLQQLKELILVGCSGIDDDGLATLKQASKPLEVPILCAMFIFFILIIKSGGSVQFT
jgi:hypothetical protein